MFRSWHQVFRRPHAGDSSSDPDSKPRLALHRLRVTLAGLAAAALVVSCSPGEFNRDRGGGASSANDSSAGKAGGSGRGGGVGPGGSGGVAGGNTGGTGSSNASAGNTSAGNAGTGGNRSTEIGPPLDRAIGFYFSISSYDEHFEYLPTHVPAQHLTHLIYGAAQITDGDCEFSDPWGDTERLHPGDSWEEMSNKKAGAMKQLGLLRAEHPHLRALIAVGAWRISGEFSDLAADPELRRQFVKSCVDKFILGHGFDGFDIAWFYPVEGGHPDNVSRPSDRENHALLVREFRTQLDALSVTTGQVYELSASTTGRRELIDNLDLLSLADDVDWFNVMAYDFALETPWHFSPLHPHPEAPGDPGQNVERVMNEYLERGVPAERLVLEVPTYGRAWGCVEDGFSVEFCETEGESRLDPGIFKYKYLAENYIGQAYERVWDDVSKAAYLYNATDQIVISYEDPESVAAKIRYARDKGFGGFVFGDMSGDNGDLIAAAVEAQSP
jgi:chitinase